MALHPVQGMLASGQNRSPVYVYLVSVETDKIVGFHLGIGHEPEVPAQTVVRPTISGLLQQEESI